MAQVVLQGVGELASDDSRRARTWLHWAAIWLMRLVLLALVGFLGWLIWSAL